MKKILHIICFLILINCNVFSQKVELSIYNSFGYSTVIGLDNYKESIAYEHGGILSYQYGVGCMLTLTNRFALGIDIGRLRVGYSDKVTQGFSPTLDFPTADNYPIYHFYTFNYNYNNFVLKGNFNLTSKLDIGLGVALLQLKEDYILIDRDLILGGQKQTGTTGVIYSENKIMGLREYEGIVKYNSMVSFNLSYQIWKWIDIDISYGASLFDFNARSAQNLYHQYINGGIRFTYPLLKASESDIR